MESSLIEGLLEYGSLGLFAGFLIWQFLSLQKRFDKLFQDFQQQIKDIQTKTQENEEKLRDRYDAVIKQYQQDKSDLRSNVSDQVSEISRETKELNEILKTLPFDNVLIQIESLSLSQRNLQNALDKVLESLKKQEEAAKYEALTKKFNNDKDS